MESENPKIHKTKAAIQKALMALLRDVNYPEIRVGQIISKAEIGRSTFYRHYSSKADVMVDIHRGLFGRFFGGYAHADAWHAEEPPQEMVAFLKVLHQMGPVHFSLMYKLGNDLDYLMCAINAAFSQAVEACLHQAFSYAPLSLPIPILAHAIAGSCTGLIMPWAIGSHDTPPVQFASYMHRTMRAILREAKGSM